MVISARGITEREQGIVIATQMFMPFIVLVPPFSVIVHVCQHHDIHVIPYRTWIFII